MAEELIVVLKRNENSGFGFSLFSGPPHVIYEIIENSPAAECGEVEAGDVIVKVNGTDVHRFTTKEVLKCLRLSQDLVTLELKRDPKVKAHIKEHLARTNNLQNYDTSSEKNTKNIYEKSSTLNDKNPLNSSINRVCISEPLSRPSRIPTAIKSPPPKSLPQSPLVKKNRPSHIPKANGNNLINSGQMQSPTQLIQTPPPVGRARFEAYMMTGDLILNLSRTPQANNLIGSHIKKTDNLHEYYIAKLQKQYNDTLAPKASGESTPSSPTNSESFHSTKSSKIQDARHNDIKENQIYINDNIQNRTEQNMIKYTSDKKESVENLYDSNNPQASQVDIKKDLCSFNSTPSPTISNEDFSYVDTIDSSKDIKKIKCVKQQQISSSSSLSSTIKSEPLSSPETSFSVPTSPTSISAPLIDPKDSTNSMPTSPEQCLPEVVRRQHNSIRKCDASGFRTSKSEDHLQQTHREGLGAIIPIDIDEDVNSSLNTLLDTRHDSDESKSTNRDRIVWTYNAPIHHQPTVSSNSRSSSSITASPQRSNSPSSPTSVSSSVMSSNSESKGTISGLLNNHNNIPHCPINGDYSVSEAISNISSPDYQDEENLLSSKDLAGMILSDPSDSDSTLLVSETAQKRLDKVEQDHKIVIKVKGNGDQRINKQNYTELKNSEDELVTLTEDSSTGIIGVDQKESSPPVSDDGSDVDSLHSYHYSPKAVDIPSAIRLAKRLYTLDGFKKSDVSRHLSKNNDFSRAVADEYLKFFLFNKQSLDESLRDFLQQFSLSGETQERERVLVHFSRRYLDCNPGIFNSQDAVHTLTCALMLLNTDLHGSNIGRKMTCTEFIDNLAELNDGDHFPKEILKHLYQSIKNHPLEWAVDEDFSNNGKEKTDSNNINQIGMNPFLDTPQSSNAVEYKKGYVMRKCCFDSNNKKTPFGKRSWKMFYCTLRDLVLYLHKDEHGFKKNQMSDNVHNAIRIHHALATKANDYTKKQHVFRLQTADQAEYLFQTSDSKELQSWIDTINYVCASFSAPALEAGVGSQKRFQRPLLPSTNTKLHIREQLSSHEQLVTQLENVLTDHKKGPIPSKGLSLQNYREKENYLQYELKRYCTYVNILNTKMLSEQQNELQGCLLNSEDTYPIHRTITSGTVINPTISSGGNNLLQKNQHQKSNRYGYRTTNYPPEEQDFG